MLAVRAFHSLLIISSCLFPISSTARSNMSTKFLKLKERIVIIIVTKNKKQDTLTVECLFIDRKYLALSACDCNSFLSLSIQNISCPPWEVLQFSQIFLLQSAQYAVNISPSCSLHFVSFLLSHSSFFLSVRSSSTLCFCVDLV